MKEPKKTKNKESKPYNTIRVHADVGEVDADIFLRLGNDSRHRGRPTHVCHARPTNKC